ncbi:MAG: helix-turn-helix domain-containing protein [Dehalococcoidia bacterium]
MADTARRARAVAIARALLAEGKTPTAEAIATAAGISRATYYRVVGGSHQALLREAGYISEPPARERVLTAATALLTEVGLSGLHMDAVAEHAGVSRPTLYRLFPGKADLLAAVTHRHAPFRGWAAPWRQSPTNPRRRCYRRW